MSETDEEIERERESEQRERERRKQNDGKEVKQRRNIASELSFRTKRLL